MVMGIITDYSLMTKLSKRWLYLMLERNILNIDFV